MILISKQRKKVKKERKIVLNKEMCGYTKGCQKEWEVTRAIIEELKKEAEKIGKGEKKLERSLEGPDRR